MSGFQWHKRACEVHYQFSHGGMVGPMQQCQEKSHTSCSFDIIPEGGHRTAGYSSAL